MKRKLALKKEVLTTLTPEIVLQVRGGEGFYSAGACQTEYCTRYGCPTEICTRYCPQ